MPTNANDISIINLHIIKLPTCEHRNATMKIEMIVLYIFQGREEKLFIETVLFDCKLCEFTVKFYTKTLK